MEGNGWRGRKNENERGMRREYEDKEVEKERECGDEKDMREGRGKIEDREIDRKTDNE